MNKQLRIVAGMIIVESNLDQEDKLSLLEYVKTQATDVEVKAFLMDGIQTSVLKEDESFVNERFENHFINEQYLEEGGWKTAAGIFFTTPAIWAMYRVIRAGFDKKSAQCGVFSIGRKRDVCLWKLRAEENKKFAQLQMKALSSCKNDKKCQEKVKGSVKKFEDKAKKYMAKIQTYSNKNPKKALKAQQGLDYAKDKKDKIL